MVNRGEDLPQSFLYLKIFYQELPAAGEFHRQALRRRAAPLTRLIL
jgi:hypothetical protein